MSDTSMTTAEQNIADEKMRAVIAKLLAENNKIGLSTFLVPFLAAAGVMGVTAAFVKLLLS